MKFSDKDYQKYWCVVRGVILHLYAGTYVSHIVYCLFVCSFVCLFVCLSASGCRCLIRIIIEMENPGEVSQILRT